jgi:hypothetical protein
MGLEDSSQRPTIGSKPEYEGPTAAQLNEDSIQCVGLEENQNSQNQAAMASPADSANGQKVASFYEACMRSRGWKF